MIETIIVSLLAGFFSGTIGAYLLAIQNPENIKMSKTILTYVKGTHSDFITVYDKTGNEKLFVSLANDKLGIDMIKYAKD